MPRHAAWRAGVAPFAAALALAASGCGQKGALYLPDSGGEVITRPMQTPAQDTTPQASDKPHDEPAPGTTAPERPSDPPR